MTTKITVVLEDDLDGGPADETVRFGIGGTDYEIDLNASNAAASAASSPCTSDTPAGRAAGSGTGRGGLPPAGGAARTSGRGRKIRASRSAAAAASPPTLSSNTKPPWEDGDACLPYRLPGSSGQPLAPAGGQRCVVGVAHARTCRCERVPSAHLYAEASIPIRDLQCVRHVAENPYPSPGRARCRICTPRGDSFVAAGSRRTTNSDVTQQPNDAVSRVARLWWITPFSGNKAITA